MYVISNKVVKQSNYVVQNSRMISLSSYQVVTVISFELFLISYLIYDMIGSLKRSNYGTLLLFLESRKYLFCCIFFYRSAMVIACIAEKSTDECIF